MIRYRLRKAARLVRRYERKTLRSVGASGHGPAPLAIELDPKMQGSTDLLPALDSKRIRLDTLGPVYKRDVSKYIRLVRNSADVQLRYILESNAVRDLVEEGKINGFELMQPETVGLKFDGVIALLQTNNVFSVQSPETWSTAHLVGAARVWVDININLLNENAGLWDAHWYNFGFNELVQPTWIDHGSINIINDYSVGLREFFDYYMLPLLIRKRRPQLAKTVGITRFNLSTLFEVSLAWTVAIMLAFLPFELLRYRVAGASKGQTKLSYRYRSLFLRSLKVILTRINFQGIEGTRSDYISNAGDCSKGAQSMAADSRKAKILSAVPLHLRESVLDIGGSDGYFARNMTKEGAEVTLVEPDDVALSRFVNRIAEQTMRCYPGVAGRPKYRALLTDFWGELPRTNVVLALALSHHLCLGQRIHFDAVAQRLRDLTKSICLVEFMPHGLWKDVPDWYKISSFESTLLTYFSKVSIERYEYDEVHPRILFVCVP